MEEYSWDDIPVGEELRLMPDKFQSDYVDALESINKLGAGSPYEIGYGTIIVVHAVNPEYLECTYFFDTLYRYHRATVDLPRSGFKAGFGSLDNGIASALFYDTVLHEKIAVRPNTIYAEIDVANATTPLRSGRFGGTLMVELRDTLDEIAEKYPQVVFFSYADGVILKGNWDAGYYSLGISPSYGPEEFMGVVFEASSVFERVLGLKAYSVLTQGANSYEDRENVHISGSGNHICLNSLGLPFANLSGIEHAARQNIREGIHLPAELYIDEDLLHSLQLDHAFKQKKPKYEYPSKMRTNRSYYIPMSRTEYQSNIKP